MAKDSSVLTPQIFEGHQPDRRRGPDRVAATGVHVQLARHGLRRDHDRQGRPIRRFPRASCSGSTGTAFPSEYWIPEEGGPNYAHDAVPDAAGAVSAVTFTS